MDIHRSRFVPYPSSAINALAFSHAGPVDSTTDPESLRLALGRANGNIEIWNPAKGAWLQERVFYGGKDRSVEGLAWTQEPDVRDGHGRTTPGRLRVFSIGYSSSVTEWDLATGLPLRHSDGNHSEVWCFAAQPKAKSSSKGSASQEEDVPQKLIAGCADGTLVLLSTADNDLRFEKFVARSTTKKARALSVAFKDREIALAGFADSMIRVYDTRNGYVIRNISLGSAGPGAPKEILVWKVKCLPSGDFLSGDSTGDVRIYDGRTYAQTQRLSGHEADVLDLAVSHDGTMIFSGGMDRRTCLYVSSKKSAPGVSNPVAKWRKVSHQRYHDHDVKALATFDGAKMSILVSGGIDAQPIVVPIREFGKELSLGLPALPHIPPLASAPKARLIVSWWNCEVRIWSVKSQEHGIEKPKVVARLALRGEENIADATITHDGGLLAVATAREVKLFQLVRKHTNGGRGYQIRKFEMPPNTGAKLLRFSADGRWLAVITAANDVLVARIIRSPDPLDPPRALRKMSSLQRIPRTGSKDSLNSPSHEYSRSITHVEFSLNGAVLAVADLAGYIDTWVTEGHEDITAPELDIEESAASDIDGDESDDEENNRERITFLGQQWIRNPSAHLLPRLNSAPAVLSFRPGLDSISRPEPNGNPAVHPTRRNPHPHSQDIPDIEQRLLVVSADHQLHLFEILGGRLSQWSRRNPPSSYPLQYRLLRSPAKGCIWDVGEHERIWIYGDGWLFMFDLLEDLPIPDSADMLQSVNGLDESDSRPSKKRKREAGKASVRRGAGDVVPERDAPITKIRRFDSGEDDAAASTWIGFHHRQAPAESDDEADENLEALASLRRSTEQDGVSPATSGVLKGEIEKEETDLVVRRGVKDVLEQRERNREHWWHTFKYRPILGMVPVGAAGQRLEVVLVERPSWDLDLPPRFVGAHE